MKKFISLAILLLFISGCANSRMLYKHPTNNETNPPQIIVYRNYMVMGSALITNLNIDGIPTAEFSGNEYVELSIPSGTHTITTINAVNVSIAERKNYENGKKYYFNATYERRTITGILPEEPEEIALDATSKMTKVK